MLWAMEIINNKFMKAKEESFIGSILFIGGVAVAYILAASIPFIILAFFISLFI